MRRGLTSRLKRLEAKRLNRTGKRLVIFKIHDDEAQSELVGLTDLRECVDRLWTDTDFDTFAHRASRVLNGARVLIARYAPERNDPDAFASPTPPCQSRQKGR